MIIKNMYVSVENQGYTATSNKVISDANKNAIIKTGKITLRLLIVSLRLKLDMGIIKTVNVIKVAILFLLLVIYCKISMVFLSDN